MNGRLYSDELTADINDKGVLDIDTVKGCTMGMAARPGVGCYGECYAAKIAKFRGLDFAQSVTRKVHGQAQAKAIERAVLVRKIIRDYLKMMGLTQAELARRAHIDPVALNHLLQGRRNAGIVTLKKLSQATGISLEQLTKDIEA